MKLNLQIWQLTFEPGRKSWFISYKKANFAVAGDIEIYSMGPIYGTHNIVN